MVLRHPRRLDDGLGPSASPAPPRGIRGAAPALAVGAVALAASAYLAVVSPFEAGHYPTCPTLALTGLFCAGCGSLRAVHELTHLDLAGAWAMNPLLVLAVPFLGAAWVLWLRRGWAGTPRRWIAPPWLVWVIFAVVVTYSVARNIPELAPFLAP